MRALQSCLPALAVDLVMEAALRSPRSRLLWRVEPTLVPVVQLSADVALREVTFANRLDELEVGPPRPPYNLLIWGLVLAASGTHQKRRAGPRPVAGDVLLDGGKVFDVLKVPYPIRYGLAFLSELPQKESARQVLDISLRGELPLIQLRGVAHKRLGPQQDAFANSINPHPHHPTDWIATMPANQKKNQVKKMSALPVGRIHKNKKHCEV